MKGTASRDVTRRVLHDIDGVLLAHDLQRTSEAVERVLQTASPALRQPVSGRVVCFDLYAELGVEPAESVPECDIPGCPWCDEEPWTWEQDLPGLRIYYDAISVPMGQRRRYAPWVVSPHLFEEAS